MAKIQTKHGCIEVRPMPEEGCFSLPGSGEAFKRQMEIVDRLYKDIQKQREEQILQRLSSLGFTFNSDIEKQQFAKDRLTVVNHIGNPDQKYLYLDYGKSYQIPIATWNDKITTSINGSEFKMTSG